MSLHDVILERSEESRGAEDKEALTNIMIEIEKENKMPPIIGILAEVDNEIITKVQNSYINAIEKSGGIPILLPYVQDDKTIESLVDVCDGFLFTGGRDIDPLRYGEQVKDTCGEIQKYRDELDLKVFQRVIATSKPILAICRGAQLVNVALGGTLYQDISTEIKTGIPHQQSEPNFCTSHSVQVFENTPLFDLVGEKSIPVNSFHHQAIKKLGEGLEVMAVAEDGIPEAFYVSGERYIRTYQWHPERLCDHDIYNRRIFDDFIEACK